MNATRVGAIVWKEWREIVRDRLFLLLAFLLPVLLMIVFGYGLTQDVENIPLAVVDYDRSAASRDYAQHYLESRYFHFQGYVDRVEDAEPLIASGRVRVVVVIGKRFEQQLLEGRTVVVQTVIDGTFINSARVLKGYLEAINAGAGFARQTAALSRRLGVTGARAETMVRPLRLDSRYLYNQELRTIWAIAPSLIMNILMWTSPLLVALSVVRERETGSIYNIYSSETPRLEFLLGKLLPCAGISFVNAVVLWMIATRYFGAPFTGGALPFLAATLVFVFSTSALGLLISLWVRTQQAALMIVVLLGAIVAMHFSGMFESVVSLPVPNRVISHLFPAMYYNSVIHATFLKGAGFAETWSDILVIALFACSAFGLSYLSFRKRVAM
jgi:ABC-2 type transport system permease protein/ribosome-dependent ATPase